MKASWWKLYRSKAEKKQELPKILRFKMLETGMIVQPLSVKIMCSLLCYCLKKKVEEPFLPLLF